MKLAAIIPKYSVSIHDPCCYPLGFGYVLASLIQAGHKVDVFNLNLYGKPDLNELPKYDAVLTHGFDESCLDLLEIGQTCRLMGIKTIIGGGMATYEPGTVSKLYSTTIMGEGEKTVHRALYEAGIVQGELANLAELPRPAYESMGIDEYHRRHDFRYMGIMSSRGCPHKCTFCRNLCKFRCRPLDPFFAEIDEYQAKWKIEHLVIYDNTLNVSRGRLNRIIDGMQGRGLSWSACLRADNIEESDVAKMKSAGCNLVLVGIESLRQSKLDEFNKQVTVDQVDRLLTWCEKHGIAYTGGVFLATGNDTMQDVAEDMWLIKNSKHRLQPNTLTHFPDIAERRSPYITDHQHQEIDQICQNWQTQNGATFGTGQRRSAVVGLNC